MIRYKNFDVSQGLFLTVNLEEQLIPGSFEHTLNYLIHRLDLSACNAAFHNDYKGAPAYPPEVILKIIFYCYSRGIITSRPMEYAGKTNIIVKALAGDAEPDHATIAHFISSQAEAVKKLFSQVLCQCYALGLIGGDLLDKLEGRMKEVSGEGEPLKEAIVEGDTGYFSENNLREAEARGVEVFIPDQQFRKRDSQFEGQKCHGGKGRFTAEDFEYDKEGNKYICPGKKELEYKGHIKLNRTLYIADKGREENLCEKMRKKIDEVKYRTLYGRRMQIIEPCFSDMSYCKKMNRFSLRTKRKVTAVRFNHNKPSSRGWGETILGGGGL